MHHITRFYILDFRRQKLKQANKWSLSIVAIVWLSLSVFAWFKADDEISESERRKLQKAPDMNVEDILSGDFMSSFESYAQDQFPNRFMFRTLKAFTRFYVLAQKDNNDIYIEDGYAVKLEYPLSESSIYNAAAKLEAIYQKYLQESQGKIYLSIIPDKGYFMASKNGYPSMDYGVLLKIMRDNTKFATYIDLFPMLSIDDYYKTDIHWKQENLLEIAEYINLSMGNESLQEPFELIELERPFYGVYYGHSALPLKADKMGYLTNEIIENSTVYHVENDSTKPVYDLDQIEGIDLYNIYLSGASAILEITNPNSRTDKELVVFRDSFGSSLVPLLLENYSKVTLIDIRYIASELIDEYVTFNGQDILFLYSTVILNSSSMMK